ncbi:hypothetical protein [Amphritea balenae]|uniref:Uncharacterized protein n=1 Tax=Amphritea balenae TaxID=452629 RepID=A0A3P1SRP2_9GAMM|nr:hypothetical protein [Amphritea balenae]RRC98852.1 hypothetical protein EHS89_11725 [Amphritea balenae]GGK62310.1 hypothetical protein GCM10007941_10510 [Amphritea balenae]
MKPDTTTAMNDLIAQIRETIPFDTPMSELCNGPCTGCSKKLLDFLDTEVEEWETNIATGTTPSLGEIHSLAKTSRKIYAVLKKNGLIKNKTTNTIIHSTNA